MAEEKILIIQLRQLGDILLTTPCIKAVRQQRPKARVTFLSHAMGRLVLDDCPYLDEHFSYASDWTWRQSWRLATTLRERRFDLVLDFMNNPRSAFYARMAGGERLAFRSARWPAYTRTVAKPAEPMYIVRRKFRLLAAAGIDAADVRLVLPWAEADTRPLLRLLGTTPAFTAAPLRIALSATHRRAARRWPLARYAELADRLVREWGAAVLWLWGPGEEADAAAAMALCKEPTHKSPPTSFRELAALVANMDLFIGNSNGPSHVAVAADIPSLQLHGPTDAVAWCPLTERHAALQSPEYGVAAAPAMDAISVEAVWARLAALRPVVEAYAAAARRPRLSWR